ncbi:ABC transporter ATP-binding protein [Proteinivorax tanatarense]|uniref:ABC transporter ATP-binding protein n=1 Tax=Proteinivorax tanatarense TaxID=1260629 RepID=A0AAU7VPS6_9FIRM
MKEIIRFKQFSFGYVSTAKVLKKINLEVKQGECLGLLGANGSGKTTLIKCLLGELKGIGRVEVFGMVPNISSPKFKNGIGVVFDHDLLIDYLTLEEYLFFVGNTYKLKQVEIKEKIDYYLEYFKLQQSKKRIIKFFSHGMRKKTQIIAALIHSPNLLIVDEPTLD